MGDDILRLEHFLLFPASVGWRTSYWTPAFATTNQSASLEQSESVEEKTRLKF